MEPKRTVQRAGYGVHEFSIGCRRRGDQIVGTTGFVILKQEFHGMDLVCQMDPRHGLRAVTKLTTKK